MNSGGGLVSEVGCGDGDGEGTVEGGGFAFEMFDFVAETEDFVVWRGGWLVWFCGWQGRGVSLPSLDQA